MQIADLLANFRQIATTPKEQGDLFEELVCKILRHRPNIPKSSASSFGKIGKKLKISPTLESILSSKRATANFGRFSANFTTQARRSQKKKSTPSSPPPGAFTTVANFRASSSIRRRPSARTRARKLKTERRPSCCAASICSTTRSIGRFFTTP